MFQYRAFTGDLEPGYAVTCVRWEWSEEYQNYINPVDDAPMADFFVSLTKQKIESNANVTLPTGSRPLAYFGKWAYRADPGSGRPESFVIEIEEAIRPKNADFEKRKQDGEIVVSSMTAYKAVVRCDPVVVDGQSWGVGWSQNVHDMDFPEYAATRPFHGTGNYPASVNGQFFTFSAFFSVRETAGSGWYLPILNKDLILPWISPINIDGPTVTDGMVKLNEETLDLLTELAELPETIAMARDTLGLFKNKAKRFRELAKEARDIFGGEKSLAKLGDHGAQLRLLYRYGILPLSYTLEDISKLIKEKFDRSYVKASKTKSFEFEPSISGYKFAGGASLEGRVWLKRRLDPNSSVQQLQHVFGFNIPKTLWELTPWSLVVDWFVNVGDYLSAVRPTASIQDAATWATKRDIVGTFTSTGTTTPKHKISVELHYYDRIVINAADNICLSFDPKMTTDRKLDAIAFSWQVIRNQIRKL